MSSSFFISCPFHDGDRTPSLSILTQDRGNLKAGFAHCFACGWSGNFTQVEKALGHPLDLPQDLRSKIVDRQTSTNRTRLRVRSGTEEDIGVKKSSVPFKFSPYLKERGIGEVIQRFNHVYQKDDRVVMPFFNLYGTMEGYVERRTGEKWYRVEGSVTSPMGIEEISTLDFVYVTEGQIDKMSMEEMGFKAVALGTVSNYRLISKLKNFNVCLAYDNDEAGNKARILTKEFIKGKKWLFTLTFPDGIKDPNELLLNYGKDRARDWVKANTEVLK